MSSEELSKKLIDTALEGKQRQFELILNLPMFFAVLKLCYAELTVIWGFKRAHKAVLAQYIDSLKNGVDNVQLLINCRTYAQCIEFYKKDFKITSHAIREYIIYLFSGRLLSALLLQPRDYSELFNFITGEYVGVPQTNE